MRGDLIETDIILLCLVRPLVANISSTKVPSIRVTQCGIRIHFLTQREANFWIEKLDEFSLELPLLGRGLLDYADCADASV